MPREQTLTEIQQSAILGHAVHDANVLSALRQLKVVFDQANTGAIFKRLCDLADRFKAHPSFEELQAALQQSEEKKVAASFLKTLDCSIVHASQVRIETITPDLKRWGEKQVIANQLTAAADLYNKAHELQDKNGGDAGQKEHDEVKAAIVDMVTQLEQVELAVTGARFESMAERLKGEAKEREARHHKVIPTGISYLDDATGGGIGPQDFWVVSGQTGFGKTQTLLSIAQAAGQAGKKVVFFALEAEEKELERRAKFSTLLHLFNRKNPGNNTVLDIAPWLKGDPRTCKLLAPFEAEATAILTERLGNVQTFYRSFGPYTPDKLKRDIYTKARNADLILIDHLGYIDLGSNANENQAVGDLMRQLSDLSRTTVPIVLAAQTRKGNGGTPRKFAPLIPNSDDINGSKQVTTCATNVVMLARLFGPVSHYSGRNADGDLIEPTSFVRNPTLIHLQKFRAGDQIRHTAVCSYNKSLGSYEQSYAIGMTKSADTVWEQVSPPDWATNATLRLNDIDPKE